jgi:hypothetical protein
LVLWASPVAADEPTHLACNPQESADVCELKVQRNDSLDQVAIEKRKEQLMRQAEERSAQYWKEWVDGDLATAGWWSRLWAWLADHGRVAKR